MENLSGRIIKGVGGLYEISLDGGGRVFCPAKGAFRHDGIKPLPGDFVLLRESAGEYAVESILPRKNELIRPPLSNLDILFIVFAASKPAPVLATVDKLTAVAEQNGIEPVIVVTKSDIDRDEALRLCKIYSSSGFKAFITGNGTDTSEIEDYFSSFGPHTTAAFAGASGVGKSTLLNDLFPFLSLQTGEISKRTQRGKHTTRHVELYPLPGHGYIADTPGFGILDFSRFDFFSLDELVYNFRDFLPYLGKCKYKKCTHLCEDGCAVVQAVENGDIQKSRHESYCELYASLKNKHSWE